MAESRKPPKAARRRARRIRLLSALCVCALAALGARAAFLSTVQAGDLSARAEDQRRVEVEIPARRGAIVTRDGLEMAAGRPALFVTADPEQITDPIPAAQALAPLLGRKAEDVHRQLSKRSRYEVLHRALDPEMEPKIRALGIPGVAMADVDERFYPQGKVAAQLVGLTAEGGGEGLERQYDDALTGSPGRRVELQDPFRRTLRVLENSPPVPGRDVRTTVDSAIQEYVENVLLTVRNQYGAQSASAVVMRPSDGAIYAMATVPRYDPNDRVNLPLDRKNRPVTDIFEPGSTFKIVTIAGALEEGLVTPNTMFDLPTSVTLFDETEFETTLREAHERPPVRWPVKEILQKSSNIGTYRIADLLEKEDKMVPWIERFGFGKSTGVDLPGEVPGIVKPGSEWSGVSILNIPIGQGISTTLLQMTRAYAAVANGGVLVTPHVASRVGGKEVAAAPGKRIISKKTARQLTEMLEGVVSPDGTGSEAEIPGYDVAGKTGTSNKIAPDGTYDQTRYWASFIGYLPARDPKVLIAVVVDEPGGGSFFGGDVAAPVFEQIGKFAISRLAISP